MVIQSNMSPNAIVEVWGETELVFTKYKVPLIKQTLEKLVDIETLPSLLKELNSIVGSSNVTCIDGG